MKKRILSMLLALVTLLSMLPTPVSAASSLDEAMAEVDVYGKKEDLNWLTMNGSVKTQHYTYYNYRSQVTGETKEIPAYCVDPNLYGVPALAPDEGTPIKYSATETGNDPKIMGILANGYPHIDLDTLGVNTIEEAYYATKTALWCYLISGWDINKLGINPSLSGEDRAAAERVLEATKFAYTRGMRWNAIVEPKLTATPDRDTAYPVTINGEACYQQVFKVTSETWSYEPVLIELTEGAPAGAKILDMNNNPVSSLSIYDATNGNDGYSWSVKVVYPAASIEGQTGTCRLSMRSTVVQYEIYFAKTLERDTYGNIQEYMLDTDPHTPITGSAVSSYTSTPTTEEDGDTGLRIRKLETGTEIPLAGAIFEVTYPDGSKVSSLTTSSSGLIYLPLDITGNYTVTELSPPKDHLLPELRTQSVVVVHGKVAEVTFYNDPYGNLRVEKYSDTGEPLRGVTIQIKHIATGETWSGQTGAAGVVEFQKIPVGGYEVRETAGIRGWQFDGETVQTVSVTSGATSTVTFTNKELPGLRILKYDLTTHQPLPDVTFEIFKDGLSIGRYTTGEMGEILLTNLEPGTYLVKEVATDDDHVVDSTPQEIELSAGDGIRELVFFNSLKPGMHLIKVDSITMKPLPNVRFEFKLVGGSYRQEFTTDQNGEIDLSRLDPGTYEVRELEAPSGYLMDDSVRVIKIEPDQVATFVFTNTPKPSLRIIKVSSDGTPLAGVHFRIAKIEDGSRYLDRITDEHGEILIDGMVENLEPGVYSVQETATTSDHILDLREYHVELFPGKTSVITIENQRRPDLIIRKTDKDTGEPVPGVTFTLRGADGPTVTTEATGPDGTVKISNLLPGVYTVTEQSVPENYILDTTPQTVTLFPNRVATVQFQNYQRPTLKIAKVDINGRPLTGAIFEVKTKAGVKIGDFPVGLDGTITVPNIHLDEGYYIITEIQAPEGYILDKTPHEVYLRPGKTTEISIENEKKPGLTIYKIDSVVGDGIKGAKFKIYVSKDKTENGTYQELDSSFYYTDANGIIHLENLDTGWYKIVEVEPAAGFSMKEPHEQIIYVEHDKSVEVTFENTPLNAIIVEKYDSVTHEALPGCTFRLRYFAGTSGTGGTVIGTQVTSKNGTIIWTGLKPGAYVVEEIDPADGYSIINSSETVYLADSGEQSVITVIFTNSPDGSLLVRKVCAVNPGTTLQDAEFKITYSDGTLIGDSNGIFVTDENGEILIDGLKPGKSVVVTETRAPAGFIIDTQSQTIQIKEGRTVSLTFKNQPKGGIIVQKRDSITGQPLPGAQFRITTAAGCEIGLDGVIGTSTLTQNGIFTTDSSGEIRISNLAPGAYVLTEIKAPAGYAMDSPSTNVVIGANGDTQTVIVTNTPKGGLIVEKYDSVTKQPLDGAVFKIMMANGELTPDNEGLTSSNGLYTTDRNGQIILSKLLPGTYVVSEEKAPDNYQADPKPQTVVVNAGDTQTIRFYDDPLCTLTILKRDAVTRKPLANATFLVRDSEGRTIGPNNGLYTTGTDGTVTVTGMTPNATIVVSETKAPTGYILDETPKTIVVRSGVANSLIFDNQPGTTLIIRKFIEGTENEPLSGVAFKVVDGSGAAVGPDDGVYYTDKAGEIVLDGIEPGTTVTAREIKTVEGFVLDGTPQDILIKGGEVQRLTFWNKRAGTLVIQKKDSVSGALISGAQFQLTYANGGYVDNDNGHLSSNGLYTTDANGEIRITGITGTVVAKEVQAAPGYVIDSSTQTQTVTVNPEDTQTLVFLNEPLCSLTLTKLDSVTGKPVPGTEFTVKDGNGNVIGRYVTGADGTVTVTGLIPGNTYVVYESKVPSGYVLDPTPQTITVQNGSGNSVTTGAGSGSGTGTGNGNGLTFENDPTTTLVIEKYITGTTNPLKGVTFLITDSSGAVVGSSNGEFITDENGRIVIEDLEPGTTITAREIKTVEGYVLDTTPKSIKIKAGEAQTLRFYNEPQGAIVIRKLDQQTGKPLAGVEFEITYSDGSYLDDDYGHLSSKGLYTTDQNGEIRVSGVVGTLVITETKTLPGYVMDEGTKTQTVKVNPGDTQTITVYNTKIGGLTIVKKDEKTGKRIKGVEFEVRKLNGEIVGTYTTDVNGVIRLPEVDKGWYQVVELKAADGYKLDSTPHQIEVKDGQTATLEITNMAYSGIEIHKIDAVTGAGIYGVTFLLYDSKNNVVGQYTSDDRGYIRIEEIAAGRYRIRELENPGYIVDTQLKTVEVKSGEVTLVEWKNTPITGQIQITKKSADYNSANGLPAGTLLEGAVFEIYNKANNLVDTIKSDNRGLAVSRALPLGRYTIREVKAPANYGVNDNELTAYLEHEGQIVRFEVSNKSLITGVSITKTGPKEIVENQVVRYQFSRIANTSNVRLDSFYWRDTLPAEVRLESVTTGTYNFPGNYKIVYRVNGGDPKTLADNLSTSRNYTIAASAAALGLAANERVTEVMFVFGQAPAGFAQVEAPSITCKAVSGIAGKSFTNAADVGGVYNGTWVQAVSRWVTTVYGKPQKLPRTGY